MISQKVNQGTARPTHYEVVLNETGIELTDLERFT